MRLALAVRIIIWHPHLTHYPSSSGAVPTAHYNGMGRFRFHLEIPTAGECMARGAGQTIAYQSLRNPCRVQRDHSLIAQIRPCVCPASYAGHTQPHTALHWKRGADVVAYLKPMRRHHLIFLGWTGIQIPWQTIAIENTTRSRTFVA